jgi:hypothetical protein
MIIGEHSRGEDLEVNPVRAKQLTNMRTSGTDEKVRLAPPRAMALEEAIGYVAQDELIEVRNRDGSGQGPPTGRAALVGWCLDTQLNEICVRDSSGPWALALVLDF